MQTEFDEMDERILEIMRSNARLTNIDIARRLDVSEATVRNRLKVLLDSDTVKVSVVADFASLGLESIAVVRLSVRPSHLDEVGKALIALDEVVLAVELTGEFNIQIHIITSTYQELALLVQDKIEKLPGIKSVDVRPIVNANKHDYHYVRAVKDKA